MEIEVYKLGWKITCCGCRKEIQGNEKTYRIGHLIGVSGWLHLCDDCVKEISDFRENNK